MTERRSWTQEEDRALKYLKDVLQVKKWSQISRKLEFEFNVLGRNGKQCRERYTNHLDSSIISKEFSIEDQEKLFKLHDKIGNKWSLISKQFTGRTDNHIKNHFHSKLRKGIRKLNKEIKQHFKKTIKPFKLTIIYKVVEASDYRFCDKLLVQESILESLNQLKNLLLQYAGGIVEKSELSSLSYKDQALFLTSKLQTFEKFIKNKKMNEKCEKKLKGLCVKKMVQILGQHDSTSNSENESQRQKQMQNEDSDDDNIYDDEDGSFQFIVPVNNGCQSLKSMDEETLNSIQEVGQEKGEKDVQEKTLRVNGFYSFSKDKKLLNEQNQKQSERKGILFNIAESLIEEVELPIIRMSKKFSGNSFESLREYDDYLNESEFHLIIRKFDSYSDIEAGLFE